ncbi:MAG TPA: tetratricopeptide repeat protein [Bacteroidia bacterium]
MFNDYALDDAVVMTQNKLVEKGLTGIPELLTTDYFSGFTKQNLLTEARYRPFSLILFALEHQFFGAKPFVSHLISVLFFVLLIVILFKLLNEYIFSDQGTYLSFIACLLFVVHPIHTEVIANIKSRDETIAFLLMAGALILFFQYVKSKNKIRLILSLASFYLALLTKETAVTFIGIVPLALYFFSGKTVKQSALFSVPFMAVFAVYMLQRYLIVGFHYTPITDVTNSPYIEATFSEAFATKVFVLLKYIGLLFFPYTLTTDYGYNQIPYINLSSIKFIISFLAIAGLLLFSAVSLKKRSLFSFCILYFFATISVGTNFIIDLGTPMAERMLFVPSFAFCICVAVLLSRVSEKWNKLSYGLFGIILFLFSIKTIARNSEWKNNETLFLTDVESSPNSSRINLYAADQYLIKAKNENNVGLRNEYLQKAVFYCERSRSIHAQFSYTYLNLGLSYYYMNDYAKAAGYFLEASRLEPSNLEAKSWKSYLSDAFYKQGNGLSEKGEVEGAISCYKMSVELDSTKIESWYNLGGNYFIKNDSAAAYDAWKNVRKLDPAHPLRKDDFIKL